MASCCQGDEYGSVFTAKEARRSVGRFRRKGLSGPLRELARWLSDLAPHRSLLEVGGGVGALQVVLLESGAVSRAVNVDLSASWEEAATELLRERGLMERVERVVGDFVELSPSLAPADVVVLHRVVCCYPDWAGLLAAAESRTGRLLAVTFPVDHVWNRAIVGLGNLLMRLRRSGFRAYVHPPEEMIGLLESRGLQVAHDRSGPVWRTVLAERRGPRDDIG